MPGHTVHFLCSGSLVTCGSPLSGIVLARNLPASLLIWTVWPKQAVEVLPC